MVVGCGTAGSVRATSSGSARLLRLGVVPVLTEPGFVVNTLNGVARLCAILEWPSHEAMAPIVA